MKQIFALSAFFTLTLFSACKKETVTPPDPTAGLTKQAEGYAVGAAAKVQLFTKENVLNTGYTRFYISLSDSVTGNRITDAHIHLMPMMDMGMMAHSAPFENPASEEAVNQLYPCSVTFIMPSTGGTWTLKVHVHNHSNGKEGALTIPLTITEPAKSKIKSFIATHDAGKYFIAMVQPSAPKIGMNDFEFAVYRKASMMSFPADSSLRFTVTPEMPTMNHGSPNNVNPVHIGNGHYKGSVNFTMTGLWRLNLGVFNGAAAVDPGQSFDLEF
jgi:hypothetical protein